MKEIIIVDDSPTYLVNAREIAEDLGLKPITFDKPSEALAYLKTRENAPWGCIVDMKPYGVIPKDFSLDEYPESPIPEQIFNYVKERKWTENFYFITGGLSDYDQGVIDRTGAKYFLKEGELLSRLEQMLGK